MANHLELGDIQALQVTPYPALRPTLQSGDLLFASGRYMISRLIQRFTHSPWSHVGIVFHLASIDRVMLLESVEDVGVRVVPLSKYLEDYDNDGRPYDGLLVIARLQGMTPEGVKSLAQFGGDELGRPFNADEVAAIATRIALGIGRHSNRSRAYMCSELVQACFNHAGFDIRGDEHGFISPESIWTDSRIQLLARIQ